MAAFRQWNWPLFAAHDTSSGTRESLQCRASPLSHDSGSAGLFLGPGREREPCGQRMLLLKYFVGT
jgi:hypothetical protein